MALSPQTHSSVGDVVDMVIVGESLGDKRKRPETDSEDQGRGGRAQSLTAALAVQAEESAVEEDAPSFSSHDTLRKHLMAQSHKQAQQRKARAMKLPRATPYAKSPGAPNGID